ncbi:hypothetical protein, conserved [Babesia ovata]|uniref:Uncharacterized protein n=1 Tax=Babesia ovata TaxID=189622 RepID=A0A2H6KJT9_9APIC|nr:uncharacterized protein BOVATA_047490 [Babesia ovata]GBE63256.1 hypothetical protein, conserved [Babesia ovata]
MYQGSKEFPTAIEAVTTALQEWDTRLQKRTNALKQRLSDLQSNNYTSFNGALNELSSLSGDALSKVPYQLGVCIQHATELLDAFKVAKKAYSNLDAGLQKRLSDSVNKVELEVEKFHAAATNDELRQALVFTEGQITELEKEVKDIVDRKVHGMEDAIYAKFEKQIRWPIEDVNKKLSQVNRELEEWIREAGGVVRKAVDKCNVILLKVEDRNGQPTELKKAAQTLQTEGTRLLTAAKEAKEQVEALVPAALGAVKIMNDALKGDLHKVREGILNQTKQYATTLPEQIRKVVEKITDEIATRSGTPDSLLDIIEGVKKYAKQFESKFSASVEKMVTAIVNGAVDQYITWYVGSNQGKFNIAKYNNEPQQREAVKKVIQYYLPGYIRDLITGAALTAGLNDITNVSKIGENFREFSKDINRQISSIKAEDVAQQIEGELERVKVLNASSQSKKEFLQSALEIIVSAVNTFSTNMSQELKLLMETCSIVNLESAMATVKGIGAGIGQSLTTVIIPPAGTSVTTQIYDKITRILTEHIGEDDLTDALVSPKVKADKVKIETGNFANYKTYVIQPVNPTAQGRLPDEINKIQSQGMASLNAIPENTVFTCQLEAVNKHLTEITTLVSGGRKRSFADDGDKGVKILLQDLCKGLGNDKVEHAFTRGLAIIKTKIENILGIGKSDEPNTLKKILKDAGKFYNEVIQKHADDAITDIHGFITEEVTEKIRNIQHNVKDLYYTKISGMFNEMKESVNWEISAIDKEIKSDLYSGVKGFLKGLRGNFEMLGLPSFENRLGALKERQNVDPKNGFNTLSNNLKDYLDPILTYVQNDLTKHLSNSQYPSQLSTIHSAVDTLLSHLSTQKHFDHKVPGMLAELKTSVQALHSTNFGNPAYPVLDAFPKSLVRFVEQLERGYVNRYEGGEDAEEFKKFVNDYPKNDELISYGTNLSKVLLTLMEGLRKDVFDLQNECGKTSGGWRNMNIISSNKLGEFFSNRGYLVSKVKQDGELRNHDECKGEKIKSELLTKKITEGSTSPIIKAWKETNKKENPEEISLFDIADFLREFFRKYYEVCQHIHIDKPTSPSNIYQMLQWLSGLYFNPMYEKVKEQFSGLFDKDTKQLSVVVPDKEKHTKDVTLKPSDLDTPIQQVCLRSQLALTAILGHGHADGRYACDFRTNLDKLSYPSNASSCLDMLVDILKRVCLQTYFLYLQCKNSRFRGGWADCHYGRYVGGSSWNCNEFQCANLECKLSGNQNGNLSAGQRCDQHPICGVKSPLQSFLEDGLPGFLPHSFKTPGCKLTCSLRNHNGIPCKTPMGFSDIGIVASHTQKGAYLLGELKHFCGPDSKLNKLCSYLNCLLRVAPQTLSDMFAFYHRLLRFWGDKKKTSVLKSVAFDEAVRKANFGNKETKLDVTFIHQYDSHSSNTHKNGDLFSLINCNQNSNPVVPCGPYLQPLSLEGCDTFSAEHQSDCHAIVRCKNTHPTLYAYGLTFKSPSTLCGEKSETTKRTCQDFCQVLQKVCHGRSVLADLVINKIPAFLWEIRYKFFYTLVALWSLSLLYLLHIAVVRLDVLRIRSHLRSPASHRIAAQSLLAAARVKALANVKYFSP